ncbi:MAG: hypothetical protein AAGD06_08805 [Acidobacteriota bacterium]
MNNAHALPNPTFPGQALSGRTLPGRSIPGPILADPVRWLPKLRFTPGSSQLRHLRRALRTGRPVTLGTQKQSFEALPERDALLDLLERAALRGSATAVTLLCRSAAVLETLPRLAQLDQDHAIVVDVSPAGGDDRLGSQARQDALARQGETVRRLSQEGIATRWDLGGTCDDLSTAELRTAVAAAASAGATDVRCEGEPSHRLERLRLEFGFPRVLPGRG